MAEAPWHFGPFKIQPSARHHERGRRLERLLFAERAGQGLHGHGRAGGDDLPADPPEVRPVGLRLAAIRLVLQDRAGADLELLFQRGGPAEPQERLSSASRATTRTPASGGTRRSTSGRGGRKMGYGGSMLVNLAHRTSFSLALRTVKYDYESVVYGDGFDVRERLNRRESYANLSLLSPGLDAEALLPGLRVRRVRVRVRLAGGHQRRPERRRPMPGSSSRRWAEGAGAHPAGLQEIRRLGRRTDRIIKGLVGDSPAFDPAGQAVRHPGLLCAGCPLLALVRQSLLPRDPAGRRSVGLSCCGSCGSTTIIRGGSNEYPLVGGGGPDVKRLDIYTIHSGGVYFRLRKTVALGIIASWWARDSNIDAEDDNRTFFGLNLTYDF